jgi:UDP-N-acetylglucosamine--N-acetylmuramyl-(pentapeptide) pyrophosphoryl-undecaprenol N-acetylglucosamine transferase
VPSDPTILFAGGGSGGHLSPGLAIDERLREIAPNAKSVFLCSNRAIDATMLGEAGVRFVALPATPPSIRPLAAMGFLRAFRQSQRQATRIMHEDAVTHVVALGGFVAAPVAKAAKALGVPVLLLNLDAPPGKANRWMARYCTRVVSAIELPMLPGFASVVVGLPIRRRALAPAVQRECRLRLGVEPNLPLLLITGASQGATSINALMLELARRKPELFAQWQVLHLAGHGADQPLRDAYAKANIRAKVEPFVHEMGLAWGAADLCLSRAGANSVAEIAVNAVPTLFLPYPHHADLHQRHNAQPLVDIGGAAMEADVIDVNENLRTIAPVLENLLRDASARDRMRGAMKSRNRPDAATTIARMVIEAGTSDSPVP